MHIEEQCGEGNGTPLQYSCLETHMDGGAWQAAVHGVAKSRTRLSNFTFTFQFHALEKEMATHSSVLAWRIPGTTEPGGRPSVGRTELDTTEATQQQQQQSRIWGFGVLAISHCKVVINKDLTITHYLSNLYHIYFLIISRQIFCQQLLAWNPWQSFSSMFSISLAFLSQSLSPVQSTTTKPSPFSLLVFQMTEKFITMFVHCLQPQFRQSAAQLFFPVPGNRGSLPFAKIIPSSEVLKPFSFFRP